MKGLVCSVALVALLVVSCSAKDAKQEAFEYAHNIIRQKYEDTGDLVWDGKLAREAKVVADGMTKTKVVRGQAVLSPFKYGDNAAFSEGNNLNAQEISQVVFNWYSGKDLKNAAGEYEYTEDNMSKVKIVWGQSKKIGCAYSKGQDLRKKTGYYVLCRYDRLGKYGAQLNEFIANLKAGEDPAFPTSADALNVDKKED